MASFGFASDGTLKEMVEAQKVTNSILQAMMAESMAAITTDLQAVRNIVARGAAESVFSIGGQITDDWTESVSGKVYGVPHDIVKFDTVELQDGEEVPGMFLQWHYATPFTITFDEKEAFYYASEALSKGVYNITFGATFGKCVKGTTYHFELNEDLPEGGQLVFESNIYSNDPAGTNVLAYESATATTALSTGALIEGEYSAGDLGTILLTESGNLNSIQKAVYGSNRWSQSAIRQYLNSSAGIGEWWSAQTGWDRAPSELTKYPGFMSGYDSAFLNAIQKVKVTTALNTVADGGGSEDTYDYFFLPSLEQMYITPQSAGVEGEYFPYWKRAVGSESTAATGTRGAVPLIYGIDAQTTARITQLRSAQASTAYNTFLAYSTGAVGSTAVSNANRCAPVCVVC